jgi:protein-S-isoprenylcysteine O-methyltransferase Ste14
MLVLLHKVIVFWMLIPFPYFMTVGGNMFTVPPLHNNGAVLGQISFLSGMACVLGMGLFSGLLLTPALCGCLLALCSVLLYEWTRRTVVDRDFYIALSGEVPKAVCDKGPYRFVRHPFYLSYMMAFLAVAIAFPSFIVGAVCLLNIGLFLYMAIDDERVLLGSALAADYRAYQARAARFVPGFKKS